MIKNWKISCYLRSPLAGEPPLLDSLLEWELSLRLGLKFSRKMTRDIPLSKIEKPPIPVSKITLNGFDLYRSSNPIISNAKIEWQDFQSKRFDSSLISIMLKEENRKSILVASGPYKMRYFPIQVKLVDRVIWFVRGDRKEINKLLKKIVAIGKYRHIGYGMVDRWEFEEIDKDYSIFALQNGKKVLMKTVPTGEHLYKVTGFMKTYGSAFSPYWHPETFMEIAIPC